MSGLNSKEIKHVYKKGKKVNGLRIIVYYLPFCDFKVSPVVSKKISKKAVVRNRIKRRIRSLASEVFKKGYYVVVVKTDISEISFEKLKNEFKKLASKLN